jgi:membrane protein YqaA with SNARE-associated domain
MELLTLFISGFSSSTLLPGSSEALFMYLLSQQSWPVWLLIIVVGSANSLGGMTNWIIGILIHKGFLEDKELEKKEPEAQQEKDSKKGAAKHRIRAEQWLEQHGAPILFFSFLPVIGDPLCLVAGLVKISWYKSLFYITLGKFSRYIVIAYIMS